MQKPLLGMHNGWLPMNIFMLPTHLYMNISYVIYGDATRNASLYKQFCICVVVTECSYKPSM